MHGPISQRKVQFGVSVSARTQTLPFLEETGVIFQSFYLVLFNYLCPDCQAFLAQYCCTGVRYGPYQARRPADVTELAMSSSHLKAVLFDIGGVVVQSPLLAIREYEIEHGIPNNYINCLITGCGSQGAWQKFERGEISLFPFYEQFSQELSDVDSGNKLYVEYCERKDIACPELPQKLVIDGRELFGRMMRTSQTLDKYVYEAILRIRAAERWRVIALTNNYSKIDASFLGLDIRHSKRYPGVTLDSELRFLGWERSPVPQHIRNLFDDFLDSSEVGMRKPERRFYLLACERNHIRPQEAIFLDDLGLNLKAARELGMETIHVPMGGTVSALRILGDKLGIDLTQELELEANMPSKL